MKKYSIIIAVFLIVIQLQAQVEPEAGNGKHGSSHQVKIIVYQLHHLIKMKLPKCFQNKKI